MIIEQFTSATFRLGASLSSGFSIRMPNIRLINNTSYPVCHIYCAKIGLWLGIEAWLGVRVGVQGQPPHPRSTMVCGQLSSSTRYWSFLVASSVKAFPGRPKQSWLDLTQSSAPGMRWCDRVSSVSSHLTRDVLRRIPTCHQTVLAISRMLSKYHLHPCRHPTLHSYD